MKVVPSEAYYRDNKHGDVVTFLKQNASAVVGKNFGDSAKGKPEIQVRKKSINIKFLLS